MHTQAAVDKRWTSMEVHSCSLLVWWCHNGIIWSGAAATRQRGCQQCKYGTKCFCQPLRQILLLSAKLTISFFLVTRTRRNQIQSAGLRLLSPFEGLGSWTVLWKSPLLNNGEIYLVSKQSKVSERAKQSLLMSFPFMHQTKPEGTYTVIEKKGSNRHPLLNTLHCVSGGFFNGRRKNCFKSSMKPEFLVLWQYYLQQNKEFTIAPLLRFLSVFCTSVCVLRTWGNDSEWNRLRNRTQMTQMTQLAQKLNSIDWCKLFREHEKCKKTKTFAFVAGSTFSATNWINLVEYWCEMSSNKELFSPQYSSHSLRGKQQWTLWHWL